MAGDILSFYVVQGVSLDLQSPLKHVGLATALKETGLREGRHD